MTDEQLLKLMVAAIVGGQIAQNQSAKIAEAHDIARKILDFDPTAPRKKFNPLDHIK